MPEISAVELQLARIAVYRAYDDIQMQRVVEEEAADTLLQRCPVCGGKDCTKDYQLLGADIVHMEDIVGRPKSGD